MKWDSVINMMPYGDRFRKHRKWLQDALIPKTVLLSYRPMQRRETCTFLAGLCDTPERVNDHIKRWVHHSACVAYQLTSWRHVQMVCRTRLRHGLRAPHCLA